MEPHSSGWCRRTMLPLKGRPFACSRRVDHLFEPWERLSAKQIRPPSLQFFLLPLTPTARARARWRTRKRLVSWGGWKRARLCVNFLIYKTLLGLLTCTSSPAQVKSAVATHCSNRAARIFILRWCALTFSSILDSTKEQLQNIMGSWIFRELIGKQLCLNWESYSLT